VGVFAEYLHDEELLITTPTFKVQGQIYHGAGSLLPNGETGPKFLQIYFMGSEDAQVRQRLSHRSGVREAIVMRIQGLLHSNNHLVRMFKTALEKMPSDDYKVVMKADKKPPGEHERLYNVPAINEVAVVIVTSDEYEYRDIVLEKRGDRLIRISETHRCYDALQYPILFWQGDDGYYFGIKQIDPFTNVESE